MTSDRYPPFRPASEAIFGYEFARRGHRVDWLMPAEDDRESGKLIRFGRGIVFAAPRAERQSRVGRALNHVRDLINDLRVFALHRRNRYDVVQVKDKYIGALAALLACKLYGGRCCYWLAYPHAEADLQGAWARVVRYPLIYWIRGAFRQALLYRVILRYADHAFMQSEQMLNDVEAKGIARERMTPVPGSLILENIPYQGDSDPGPGGKDILHVGTLIRERKLDFLIRAFAMLAERHDDARLIFVGGGENPEDEAVLRSAVRQRRIVASRVVFTGKVPREDVWQYIETSAVCLSPYSPSFILNSTSPTKLIEYMAMGRAVVANEHPEQAKVIGESDCGLCVIWDEATFAAAIDEILDSPERAAQMGRNGRHWVEQNRSSEVLADLVEGIYSELTEPVR
jgi:glycosyltransferase involved in cell wall biosynthesis